jgi:phosphatidylglycerol---prolipoprotein diacylglyceryl transferase
MSYPYLSDAVFSLTGYRLPLPFATFGLMVALALLAASGCLAAELRRLHGAGVLPMAWRVQRGVTLRAAPHEIVPNLTLLAMFAGVAGARVFHILEHLDSFAAAPWDMIFSRSGLSVLGGLLFGTVAGLWFIRRWHLPARPMLDAVAPAMMLGYAIGRIGCQVSGDGDWGRVADMALKPDWLPTWWWAQTYTNNIFGEVIAAPGVYPAPVYEIVMALAGFALLWAWRGHTFRQGWLFSLYLVLAGLERLAIEQIRVNPVLDFGVFHATQAEAIALAMVAGGIAGLLALSRRASPLGRLPAR